MTLTVSSRCISPICYEWTITGPSLDELQREILILGSDYAVVVRRWGKIEYVLNVHSSDDYLHVDNLTLGYYRVTGCTIVKPEFNASHERAWAKIMEMRGSLISDVGFNASSDPPPGTVLPSGGIVGKNLRPRGY